ncbi:hypothetical protein KIK84_04325 [Curvibacter sp. CHRR-16]|uniref:hypothetical protein n=1 Tax=Curvibacter sp. CHRR-16 TaxID=2835872 RepID=UPI001BDB5CED|nr:hypothetical protein [Curvibacter sp. CHRR-16]MBT0569540.1 hypothetical protein [Curvibacter sp. CHRR-16]
MLEAPLHQAAGLIRLGVHHSPKLLAMVSHGDENAELPLLLRLCTNMVELGYPVVVLDGTAMESNDNPGLEQALQGLESGWSSLETPGWNIIPAGLGLLSLAARNRGVLGWNGVHALFGHHAVVVVYATATVLTPLFTGSEVRPVIALSRAKTSLLTSYVALKRVLTKGHLQPLVVHVRQATPDNSPSPVTGLQEYTRQFLQYEFSAIELDIDSAEDNSADTDVQRLALGLLETAHTMASGSHEASHWLPPLVPTNMASPAVPVSSSVGRH